MFAIDMERQSLRVNSRPTYINGYYVLDFQPIRTDDSGLGLSIVPTS